MYDLLTEVNKILSSPSIENILSVFEPDGYIRLNMIYISPVTLKHFKDKLLNLDLQSWALSPNGLVFQFKSLNIKFYGTIKIVMRKRIFCMEIDFEPITNDVGYEILREIEEYLKGCDALFFMTYQSDVDSDVLNNPLGDSAEFLIINTALRK